ncbi:MAG: hypothetical protein ISN28_13905 [Ectothiorhodospiraceae bacterium AqS1]|nr:hypothetical protein [Ectothiorhodospiraceae bacterium AqS1]
MRLFKNSGNILMPIDRNSFDREKEIQSIVEANMETLFEIDLVRSEFSVAGLRLDSLAFDSENNSFVIVEYKRGNSWSVIDQGYAYLNAIKSNPGDFLTEYNEKVGKGKGMEKSEIDWNASRVIFVAPSFNKYQKRCINRDTPVELWEIKRFNDGSNELISLEKYISEQYVSEPERNKVKSESSESNESNTTDQAKKLSDSEYNHLKDLKGNQKHLWNSLEERLEEYPDISSSQKRDFITYQRDNMSVCHVSFPKRKSEIRIAVPRGDKTKEGKKSKGFFSLDDPKSFCQEKILYKSHQSGRERHVYSIDLKNKMI